MNRICRHDGCTRECPPRQRQCGACRARRHRERPAWKSADLADVALIVESPRPVAGLTRLERLLIARGLNGRDMTAEQIAAVIGVSPRTVYRWRTRPPARAQLAA